MSSPSHSLVAAAAATVSSTIFFTMNSTLNYIAFPSYLLPQRSTSKQEDKNAQPESSSSLLLRQWGSTYSRGHLLAPGTTIFSFLAYLYAAATSPSSVKIWYYVAAASAGIALPFSILFVIPKNAELYRRSAVLMQQADPNTKTAESEGEMKPAGADAVKMIREGLLYSKIRALLPLPAILISLYAIARTAKLSIPE